MCICSLFLNPLIFLPRAHSVNLASLLPKAGVGIGSSLDSELGLIVDGPSAEDLGQSLVFTNSHRNGHTATHSYAHATANSYAHAASGGTTYAHAALVRIATHTSLHPCVNTPQPFYMISVYFISLSSFQSSVLGSGFGSFNAQKSAPTSDIRTPEQLSGPRHSQRASQTLVTSSNSSVSKDAGQHLLQNPAPASSTSVEAKAQRVENGLTAPHSKLKE